MRQMSYTPLQKAFSPSLPSFPSAPRSIHQATVKKHTPPPKPGFCLDRRDEKSQNNTNGLLVSVQPKQQNTLSPECNPDQKSHDPKTACARQHVTRIQPFPQGHLLTRGRRNPFPGTSQHLEAEFKSPPQPQPVTSAQPHSWLTNQDLQWCRCSWEEPVK